MAPREIMTLLEVAEYLQLGPRSVYKLVRRGELPGRKVLGKWRFFLNDINAWISTKTSEGLEQDPTSDDPRNHDQATGGEK